MGACGAGGPVRSDATVVATAAATAIRVAATHFPVGGELEITVRLAGVVSTGSGVPRGETPSGTRPSGAMTPVEASRLCGWPEWGFRSRAGEEFISWRRSMSEESSPATPSVAFSGTAADAWARSVNAASEKSADASETCSAPSSRESAPARARPVDSGNTAFDARSMRPPHPLQRIVLPRATLSSAME
jgi:hypothetical protein